MKAFPAVFLLGTALAAYAATPAPKPAPPNPPHAAAGDDATLCQWDSPAGTHGRKCAVDVEAIDRRYACDYTKATIPDMTDHPPMLISVSRAEHMVFTSSSGRSFRVRRLIPISGNGSSCPQHPFNHEFDEGNFVFGSTADTTTGKTAAIGCKYKLEVQFLTVDPSAPVATHDPQHRHLECRDPHIQLVN